VTPRYDVSTVPLQGAYIAKRCPVRIQNDVLQPAAPLPVSAEAQLRMDQGVAFERDVFAELRDRERAGWVFVGEDVGREDAVAQTVDALERQAPVVAGGYLPLDESGRRTGRPDLLVLAGDGYVPVDVKHHLTLEVDDAGAAATSPPASPFPEEAAPRPGWARRKRKDDALQLAHYRRMLEAMGCAAGSLEAGIIGKEREVVWYDLAEPLWQTPAKSDGKKRKMRSTLEVYDFEFGFRLDIAAVAIRHLSAPGTELLVVSLRCGECAECLWRDHCDTTLLAGSGDPSLLPGVGYPAWRALRDAGIVDRAGVAALHYPTARLAADGVDLDRVLDAAGPADPTDELGALLPRAGKQVAVLEEHGITTVAELRSQVDAVTAGIGKRRFLPKAILDARAAVGEAPVYRRPGASGEGVPRGGLEIDVDMENTNDGTYLWGALVTDRAGTGLVAPGYHPFVGWEPVDEAVETEVFRSFWDWLTDLRRRAAGGGVTLRAFCWHESAENSQMRRIAAADEGLAAAVRSFIDSDEWIDLQKVFTASWMTGASTGLKVVAPLAGFDWPVDDPGGGLSMVRYAAAVDPEATEERRSAARTWILDYNRGDVEATLRIREWLDAEGSSWPEVATG
jgi:predicted RecB family nuclease